MSIVDTWDWDKLDLSCYDEEFEMDADMKVRTALHEFEYDYGVRPNRITMGFNLLRELHKIFHIGMPMNLDNLSVEYEGIPISIDYINPDNLEVGYMSKWE